MLLSIWSTFVIKFVTKTFKSSPMLLQVTQASKQCFTEVFVHFNFQPFNVATDSLFGFNNQTHVPRQNMILTVPTRQSLNETKAFLTIQ